MSTVFLLLQISKISRSALLLQFSLRLLEYPKLNNNDMIFCIFAHSMCCTVHKLKNIHIYNNQVACPLNPTKGQIFVT